MDAHIFDIDGTLVDSNDVDGDLFLEAVRFHLGAVNVRSHWSHYTHVTDTGILNELLRDNGIEHTPNLEASIRSSFVELVASHVTTNGPFAEVRGARKFVNSLLQNPNMSVAYATGGWVESARIKLESAGFPVAEVVLSAADDHPERQEIMKLALNKLGDVFDSVTYYGDAPWDQVSAESLGWNFVAIGERISGIEDYSACAA